MLELKNSELRLELLDPEADHARLGPRFCGGGFIWQVHDADVGPLLTGPEWPEPLPSPFNGQGLPESFRHRTLDGQPLTWRGDHGLALGAGELRSGPNGRVDLVTPCQWETSWHPLHFDFSTIQQAAGYHYALRRRIELTGRDVHSITRLANLSSDEPLVLEWFAHPFFPLVDGLARAEIPVDATLPANDGFALENGVFTQRRRFTSPTDGHMDRGLRLPPDLEFSATLAHPVLDYIAFETSFVPSAYVVWGNDRTFSFEPYLALNLAPGAAREWSLTYRFGPSSGIAASRSTTRNTPSR